VATRGYSLSGRRKDELDKVMARYDKIKGPHAKFVKLYDQRERSYRGVLRRASKASSWKHQLHPPYAFNLLETIVASTVEQGLILTARPTPHGNVALEEAMAMLDTAKDVEDLIRHEHRVDDMDGKQRPFYLTAAIGGRGVMKCYWNYSEGAVKRQGIQEQEIHDADGNLMGTMPTITEITEDGILRDHSTAEVIDPRDFLVHEAARSVDPFAPGGAQYCFHRCYYSYEQLLMMEASGFLKDVKYIESDRGSDVSEFVDRQSEVYNQERTRDMIEVLEYWCMEDGAVHRMWVSTADQIILKDMETNPFWHGSFPFVIGSSMPQPFSTIGVSEIELIEELQEMLWEIQNQRLDNLEMVNNAIYVIRNDVEDTDAFQAYPGAIWEVEDVQQVTKLEPPYQAAEISMNAEALLKGDLQNVSGAAPFAGGTETDSVDQKTATGASIVMNAAQQRMSYRKYEFQRGLKDEAQMRLKNCQQFIEGWTLAHVIGPDGAQAFKEIPVLDIQGEYAFDLEPMSESQMRSEKRAEAVQFFQTAAAAAPLFAATGQPFSMKELFMDLAKAWGKEDAEKYFSQDPAAAGAIAAQGGAGGAAPGQGGPGETGPNLGITAESAVDASSPSAAGGISGSPVVASQRARALQGGPRNAG